MLERKQSLKRDGIPTDREHAMVTAVPAGGGDTPATAARRRAPAARKSAARKKSALRSRPNRRARSKRSRKDA
jgi:hypothetical protein